LFKRGHSVRGYGNLSRLYSGDRVLRTVSNNPHDASSSDTYNIPGRGKSWTALLVDCHTLLTTLILRADELGLRGKAWSVEQELIIFVSYLKYQTWIT
jgi:hypothetical protein